MLGFSPIFPEGFGGNLSAQEEVHPFGETHFENLCRKNRTLGGLTPRWFLAQYPWAWFDRTRLVPILNPHPGTPPQLSRSGSLRDEIKRASESFNTRGKTPRLPQTRQTQQRRLERSDDAGKTRGGSQTPENATI